MGKGSLPCSLSTAGGRGSLQEKDGVSVGQDGPSAAIHPSPHVLRQLQPKKKHKKTTVLSTHPESKHSISRVHLTQLGGPALRELTVRASQPIQARAEAQFKPEEEGKGRRTLHSRNLDAVAAQIHLPYETYKSFLMSSKVARSSVLLSSLSAPPSLPGECPPSSSKLRAALGPWPPLS